MSNAANVKQQGRARRYVNSLLRPAISIDGFRQVGDCFELELSKQVVGVLSIGIGALDPLEIFVSVGVRFDEVESLTNRLHGVADSGGGWTIGARLCDLVDSSVKRPTVRLDQTAADQAAVAQLVDDLRHYGIPFMHEWSSLSKLVDHIATTLAQTPQTTRYVTDPSTTLPVAMALIGREKEGLAVVRRTVASLAEIKNRGYAASYLRFAAAYEEFISGKGDWGGA